MLAKTRSEVETALGKPVRINPSSSSSLALRTMAVYAVRQPGRPYDVTISYANDRSVDLDIHRFWPKDRLKEALSSVGLDGANAFTPRHGANVLRASGLPAGFAAYWFNEDNREGRWHLFFSSESFGVVRGVKGAHRVSESDFTRFMRDDPMIFRRLGLTSDQMHRAMEALSVYRRGILEDSAAKPAPSRDGMGEAAERRGQEYDESLSIIFSKSQFARYNWLHYGPGK